MPTYKMNDLLVLPSKTGSWLWFWVYHFSKSSVFSAQLNEKGAPLKAQYFLRSLQISDYSNFSMAANHRCVKEYLLWNLKQGDNETPATCLKMSSTRFFFSWNLWDILEIGSFQNSSERLFLRIASFLNYLQ